MIRVAHFSDLHYGGKTLAEADRCFGAGIDRAIELGVDAAVISGDATDHALDLHAPAARLLAEQVRRLADHCPVLLLQGTFSHEPPGTLSLMRLLGGRFAVHVADRIQQVALTLSASCGTGLECPTARVAVLPCRAPCESYRAVMHRTIGAVGVRRLSGGPDVRPAEASGRGRPGSVIHSRELVGRNQPLARALSRETRGRPSDDWGHR